MSTPADVVKDLSSLVNELAKLLETETAKQAPQIASDLGALPQLRQGIDVLKKALDQIRDGVVPLQKSLVSADALAALVGFVPPFIAALGDALQSSGAYLADLGLNSVLGDASRITAQAVGPIKQVSGVLEVGVDVAEDILSLTAPDQWTGVVGALDHLTKALLALKQPPAPAAGS